jgi:DNA-binding NtrC family response regulator
VVIGVLEMENSILIVCPDALQRAAYCGWLRAEGYHVTEAASAADAIGQHRRGSFPLTVAEIGLSPTDGVELIQNIRTINPQAELLMLTDGGSVLAAVAAMKAGAADLLLKPIDRQTLLDSVRQIGGLQNGLQESRRLREELHQRYDFSHIVAQSPQMLHVLALAGRVAPRDTSVLITGESGTGKELLARAIHVNSSRAHRPMVSINCAAIPEALLESELFGYRRGAFTGANADKPGLLATADGGTLFLDEIAELPLATQAKLLRVLQEGTYFPLGTLWPLTADVRVVAATNAPLLQRVEMGAFRRDLYYRLSVFPLHIPPLRERPEDIAPLAHHFLRQIGNEIAKKVPGFSREVLRYLGTQPWRGNVRELQNAIERAVIVSEGSLLTLADFRLLDDPFIELESPPAAADTQELPDGGINLPELNRKLIAEAMERTKCNVSAAARLLGLSRPTLRYRMRKYNIASRPQRTALH